MPLKSIEKIQTKIFRIYPTRSQERQLHEVFTIYNRMKRIGYTLLFNGKENPNNWNEEREKLSKKEKEKIRNEENKRIRKMLMEKCRNNPYVNTIVAENFQKLDQQITWLKNREERMTEKIEIIKEKIESIKKVNKYDRRLRGLYSNLNSTQNKLLNLKLKPIVFGTKRWFRERLLQKISGEEFIIKRDASFSCIGKTQGVNLNIKLLEDKTIRVHNFRKERKKIWIIDPLSMIKSQERFYNEILNVKKYTATIKRKLFKDGIRYFTHISYEIPESETKFGYEKGAVGLDLNYNFGSLTNVSKKGNLLSYKELSFRNLPSYRKNKREDYLSFLMDKIVNYCINKKKGIVIENLSFKQKFSYNKKRNRKLSNFRTTALELLERKCARKGISVRKVHPSYTSLIGKYKYSGSHNLSTHTLASFVIARRGLGFEESLPAIYKWVLSQVGDAIKPRLKKGTPYYEWSQIHDFFEHSGITSFKTSEVMKKTLQMKYVLNSATSEQPDNLKAGLSKSGKIDDWNKVWSFAETSQFL